jgi:hypothetical protein
VLFQGVWLLPAVVGASLTALLALYSRSGGRGTRAIAATFGLGAMAGACSHFGLLHAETITGLSLRSVEVGEGGALIFALLVAEPVAEVMKVIAVWPALLSRRILDLRDGVRIAASSSLGFAAVDMSWTFHSHATSMWLVRCLFALPGDVFFACAWGAALGLAKAKRWKLPVFPLVFITTVAVHGFYAHLVYGRGPGALIATFPLLAVMFLAVIWFGQIVSPAHSQTATRESGFWSRVSRISEAFPPPSLATVQSALGRQEARVNIPWVVLGTFVYLGTMIVGVGAGVAATKAAHVDLAAANDQSVASAAPLIMLAIGLVVSLPVSGWIISRASARRSRLEPALSAAAALGIFVVALGVIEPVGVVFALAVFPVAWVAACIGAWLGRPV